MRGWEVLYGSILHRMNLFNETKYVSPGNQVSINLGFTLPHPLQTKVYLVLKFTFFPHHHIEPKLMQNLIRQKEIFIPALPGLSWSLTNLSSVSEQSSHTLCATSALNWSEERHQLGKQKTNHLFKAQQRCVKLS